MTFANKSWLSLTAEHRHLRRRSDLRIFRTDRKEADRVRETIGEAPAPVLELLARPLEAVVPVAETAGGQALPADVVLRVRSGYDHRLRSREFEKRSLEGGEPGRVEVLDDLHYRGRVEAFQPPVTVSERPVEQPDPFALLRREPVQVKPVLRHLEAAVRDVH